VLAIVAQAPGVAQADRPNILVFLVDDLGWQDTSVAFHTERTPFNERYRTPNVERLAARGLKFTQAYASAPVCTPTRTSLMTGRSPGRNHITYWTLHKDRDQSAKYPRVRAPAWNVNALQAGDVTLPRLLQAAGYRTIHVGKAHLGAMDTSGADPRNLGFDVNIGGHAAGGPGSYYGRENFSAAHRKGASVWDVPGLEAWHGQDVFLTEALTAEACVAVAAAVRAGEPFFLHMATYAVHAPISANERYLEHYEGLDPREAAYATMVESYDAALGTIVAKLDELEVLDDTLIVFTSDNGGLSAHARGGEKHTHNAPLRSGKGSAYEGGIRVPQIIAWPGVTKSGTCDVPVVTHDLFPTLLAVAGVAIPAEHARTVEGIDLTPLLRGEPLDVDRSLFWNQPHFWGVHGPGIWPFSAIRRGDWKLVYKHEDRSFELYDLAHDIGESTNRAADEPERVRDLAERLSAWFERVDAQLSIDIETGLPIELPRVYAR